MERPLAFQSLISCCSVWRALSRVTLCAHSAPWPHGGFRHSVQIGLYPISTHAKSCMVTSVEICYQLVCAGGGGASVTTNSWRQRDLTADRFVNTLPCYHITHLCPLSVNSDICQGLEQSVASNPNSHIYVNAKCKWSISLSLVFVTDMCIVLNLLSPQNTIEFSVFVKWQYVVHLSSPTNMINCDLCSQPD